MKCCSRSTLGVVVGVLNVVSYAVATILIIYNLIQINYSLRPDEKFRPDDSLTALTIGNIILSIALVVCVLMVIISSIFIKGIIERRHTLMTPWLVISAIGFVLSVLASILRVIAGLVTGAPFTFVLFALLVGFVTIVLQYLILNAIYNLYKDIRAKKYNNEQPLPVVTAGQMGGANNYVIQENVNKYNGIPEKF